MGGLNKEAYRIAGSIFHFVFATYRNLHIEVQPVIRLCVISIELYRVILACWEYHFMFQYKVKLQSL